MKNLLLLGLTGVVILGIVQASKGKSTPDDSGNNPDVKAGEGKDTGNNPDVKAGEGKDTGQPIRKRTGMDQPGNSDQSASANLGLI